MKRFAVILFVAIVACSRREATVSIGDPVRGRKLTASYGCNACHSIPGVAGQAMVGPPLTNMASRAYIAGRLPNQPLDMIDWIRAPRAIDPGTAMPDLGVTERDARDMTAFLFTLR